MNVANLDLCKALYEVSGWRTGEVERNNPHESMYSEKNIICFRYDLGYLLRKLPDEVTSKKHGGYHYFYMHHGKPYWYAYYGEIDTTELMAVADTPEDAAAKLAIELFKQNILAKEQN